MAKTDNNTPFGDFTKKVKLSSDRKYIQPRPTGISDDEYLVMSIKEGHAILAAEGTGSVKQTNSVKSQQIPETPQKLQDALAKVSTNPYIRARAEIMGKLTPAARSVIEKMENNELPKDARYNTFCAAVTARGDQLSSQN